MTDIKQLAAINQRVWYVEGGVHPSRAPQLLVLGKVSDDPSQTLGEETRITAPDPNNYSRDIQIGTVEGNIERAKFGIGSRYTAAASILQRWKNLNCRVDIFVLSGKCGNPQDFVEGGEKWTYFPDGKLSGHNFENFGAYGLDENNPTNEKVPMTSEEYYEFLYLRQEQVGASVTTREIMTVDVYRGDNCDDCPNPCQKVLATMAGASATPGTQPVLLYSDDGGNTWASQTITTLFSNEKLADGEVLGGDIAYVSNEANEIHWTSIKEIYDGTNVWNQTNTGFVAGKNATAITASDVRHIWISGFGGYIYFTNNHRTQVTVQDAGVATTQHLRSIHAFDNTNVLAVGDSNAVVYTINGGGTWESVTGPAVGVNMGACWMWSQDVWFVGEGAGGQGRLWVTYNAGKSWTRVPLPATYQRIDRIKFVSEAEGYLSVRSGGDGFVLRTITAGNEWMVLPQGKKGVPYVNAYLSDLAVCSKYANTAYAAGLADNGTAGIILRHTGA